MVLSDRALALAMCDDHIGQLYDSTHSGLHGEKGEGPFFYFWFVAQSEIVRVAKFESLGCPTSRAVGTAICKLSVGRPLSVLASLEVSDVVVVTGGVPEGKSHIPILALQAIKNLKSREK